MTTSVPVVTRVFIYIYFNKNWNTHASVSVFLGFFFIAAFVFEGRHGIFMDLLFILKTTTKTVCLFIKIGLNAFDVDKKKKKINEP